MSPYEPMYVYIFVSQGDKGGKVFQKVSNGNVVNKSIKNFILKIKPESVFSGHLHENARKEDKSGKIKIIKR